MEVSERISKVVEHSGLSVRAFSARINVKTPQAIRDLIAGRTKKISPNVESKILSSYPEVNRIWLLTGEGEMLAKKKNNEQIRFELQEEPALDYEINRIKQEPLVRITPTDSPINIEELLKANAFLSGELHRMTTSYRELYAVVVRMKNEINRLKSEKDMNNV